MAYKVDHISSSSQYSQVGIPSNYLFPVPVLFWANPVQVLFSTPSAFLFGFWRLFYWRHRPQGRRTSVRFCSASSCRIYTQDSMACLHLRWVKTSGKFKIAGVCSYLMMASLILHHQLWWLISYDLVLTSDGSSPLGHVCARSCE